MHGGQFEFGENWRKFLKTVDEERITEAERALAHMLGLSSLRGRSFLDVGAGSGLSSLAAARLGAERIHSFDLDAVSTACMSRLRDRFPGASDRWTIEQGSVLDDDFVRSLGRWDIVYTWGVLHHTGNLERAMANVAGLVSDQGLLGLAIYNDQGRASGRWRRIKRGYNRMPRRLRMPYAVAIVVPLEFRALVGQAIAGSPADYLRTWTDYKRCRGMSKWHDLIDWIGGYPYEVARPEDIFRFYRARGFELVNLATCAGGWGCNEYVFQAGRAEQKPRSCEATHAYAPRGYGYAAALDRSTQRAEE